MFFHDFSIIYNTLCRITHNISNWPHNNYHMIEHWRKSTIDTDSIPCVCAGWSDSSCTWGRTHRRTDGPVWRTPRGTASGTRCPAHSDRTEWFWSCYCPLWSDPVDAASPTNRISNRCWCHSYYVTRPTLLHFLFDFLTYLSSNLP